MPHFDTRLIIQIDIQNNTTRLIEVAVLLKGLGGFEKYTFKTVRSQKPLHTSEQARIVIHYENNFRPRQRQASYVEPYTSKDGIPTFRLLRSGATIDHVRIHRSPKDSYCLLGQQEPEYFEMELFQFCPGRRQDARALSEGNEFRQ